MAPKNQTKRIVAKERKSRAWALRLAGATQKDIASQIGVTQGRVSQYLREEMKAVGDKISEDVQKWVRLEVARLDKLQTAVWANAVGYRTGEVSVPASLSHMDRVLRISQQRVELLQLIAPTQHDENNVKITLVYPDNDRGPTEDS